jgi:hypothetical protein
MHGFSREDPYGSCLSFLKYNCIVCLVCIVCIVYILYVCMYCIVWVT